MFVKKKKKKKKKDPPAAGHFWAQGYYLNNLGRGQLGGPKYQTPMAWDFMV